MARNRDLNIARNIRVIEWLKSELLEAVSQLFESFINNQEELLVLSLARIKLTVYLLGKRAGINFARVDEQLEIMVQEQLSAGHEVEEWYGDLSLLKQHLDSQKKGL